MLNIDCLNGEYICLNGDDFYPHEATDEAQRAFCEQKLEELRIVVNDSRNDHEDALKSTIDGNVAALKGEWDTNIADAKTQFYDTDYPTAEDAILTGFGTV